MSFIDQGINPVADQAVAEVMSGQEATFTLVLALAQEVIRLEQEVAK